MFGGTILDEFFVFTTFVEFNFRKFEILMPKTSTIFINYFMFQNIVSLRNYRLVKHSTVLVIILVVY